MNSPEKPEAEKYSELATLLANLDPPNGRTAADMEAWLVKVAKARKDAIKDQHVQAGFYKTALDALVYYTMAFGLMAVVGKLWPRADLPSPPPPPPIPHPVAQIIICFVLAGFAIGIIFAAAYVAIDSWEQQLDIGDRQLTRRRLIAYILAVLSLIGGGVLGLAIATL